MRGLLLVVLTGVACQNTAGLAWEPWTLTVCYADTDTCWQEACQLYRHDRLLICPMGTIQW